MRRMLLLAVATLFTTAGLLAFAPSWAAALGCTDFPSQASAQDYYRQHPAEVVTLDPDKNGIACESSAGPFDRTAISAGGVATPAPVTSPNATPTSAPSAVAASPGAPDATLDPAATLAAPVAVGVAAPPPSPLAHTGSSSLTLTYLGLLAILGGWLVVIRTRPAAVRPAFDLLPRRFLP